MCCDYSCCCCICNCHSCCPEATVADSAAAGIITAHVIVARLCWLYPKTTTLKRSQRGYSRLGATKVYVQKPQHWRDHREAIHGLTPSQFVMSKSHNIREITERPFTAWSHHSLLCPKATALGRSQRGYSQPEAITVCYVRRAQHWRQRQRQRQIFI